jgi:hypothetical protein
MQLESEKRMQEAEARLAQQMADVRRQAEESMRQAEQERLHREQLERLAVVERARYCPAAERCWPYRVLLELLKLYSVII